MSGGRRLRILIPILGFAQQGGYRVLSKLADAWSDQGHDCSFLVPASSPEPYFPTRANIIRVDRKGRIHESIASTKRNGLDNIASLWAGLRKVGGNFDVWLANHSLTAWPVRFVDSPKVQKFYYIQAYEPSYYSLIRDPIKKALSLGSYFLGLSMIANAPVYPLPRKALRDIIYPGIDTEVFHEKLRPFTSDTKNSVVFGTVGRSEVYKGTATALSAYRMIRAQYPGIMLNVAIGHVEPAPDVVVSPISSDKELAAFYRGIDVLLVSCRGQHGAPHYPVIEAMACGTPVVHTGYFPGTAENSWVANGTTPEEVAAAIESFLGTSDSEIELRVRRAREFVEGELAWPSVARRFLDSFQKKGLE